MASPPEAEDPSAHRGRLRPNRDRSLLRHPCFAQAVVRPLAHLEEAWIAALFGDQGHLVRLPCRDGLERRGATTSRSALTPQKSGGSGLFTGDSRSSPTAPSSPILFAPLERRGRRTEASSSSDVPALRRHAAGDRIGRWLRSRRRRPDVWGRPAVLMHQVGLRSQWGRCGAAFSCRRGGRATVVRGYMSRHGLSFDFLPITHKRPTRAKSST
jgi:hypothetical protein